MSDHTADLTAVVEGSEGIRVIRGGGNVRAWEHIVAYDRRPGRPTPTDAPIGNA